MRNIYFFLSILILFSLNIETHAQKHRIKQTYRHSFTVNATRFILNEARIGYEYKLSSRTTARTNIGIQYPTSQESFRSIPLGIIYPPYYYEVSKGFYAGIGLNYELGSFSRLYLSGELFYNYNYYDNKYYHFCVGSSKDSYMSLESMKMHKFGLKILFGKKIRITSGKKFGFELDVFVGPGVQYRLKDLTVYEKLNGSCSYEYSELIELNPPELKKSNKWMLTFYGGILLCLPFGTF